MHKIEVLLFYYFLNVENARMIILNGSNNIFYILIFSLNVWFYFLLDYFLNFRIK